MWTACDYTPPGVRETQCFIPPSPPAASLSKLLLSLQPRVGEGVVNIVDEWCPAPGAASQHDEAAR